MAIRINTDNNEIEISDVATEETLRDLLKAVEDMAGAKGTPKRDPEVKRTQDAIKNLANTNKELNLSMKSWSGNFDDTMDELNTGLLDRSKMIANSLGKIVKNTGNVISDLVRGPASFDSLGRAIQQGASALGEGLGGAADSLQVLGTKLPMVGSGLKMLGAAAGAAAMAIAAYAQNMYDGFVALSQSGANYNADIVRTASQINALGLTMNSFTQIVQQNAKTFSAFGGSVSLGTRRFVQLADQVHRTIGGPLYALGITYDEQAEQLAKFIAMQSRNTAFQNMSYIQQSQLFRQYTTDLEQLVSLTGENRDAVRNELAQSELRADAMLYLEGATEAASKALKMVFSASGPNSAISQIFMAGAANKSLAFEMAAGNETIKNFAAGNREVADRMWALSNAMATGTINQEQFFRGLAQLTPEIEQTGKEFAHLYGANGVANVMTEAGAGVQEFNVKLANLRDAEAAGLETTSQEAEGAGGAIMLMAATLTEATMSIKSGVHDGIQMLAEEFGIGKDIGTNIQTVIDGFDRIGVELRIFAEDPIAYLFGLDITKKKEIIAGQHASEGNTMSQFGVEPGTETFDRIMSDDSVSVGDLNASLTSGVATGSVKDAILASSALQNTDESKKAVEEEWQKVNKKIKSMIAMMERFKASPLSDYTHTMALGVPRELAQSMSDLYSFDQNDAARSAYSSNLNSLKNIFRDAIDYTGAPAGYRATTAGGGDGRPNEYLSKRSWISGFNSVLDNAQMPQTSWLKQYGGPVGMGNPYIVGERGPELFTPRTGGTITPTSELSTAAGAMSVVQNIKETNRLLSDLAKLASKDVSNQLEIGNTTVAKLSEILGVNRKNNKGIQEIASAS